MGKSFFWNRYQTTSGRRLNHSAGRLLMSNQEEKIHEERGRSPAQRNPSGCLEEERADSPAPAPPR